jgi:hypothetical protein
MPEQLTNHSPEEPISPVVLMDTGIKRRLEEGESIEVNDENLQKVMAHVPEIDPAKLHLRLVGFYDNEHRISEPDEQGIVTITLPAKNAAKQLPLALSEYTDMLNNRPAHSQATEGMKTVGEAASAIVDRSGPVLGGLAVGAMPELIAMTTFRDAGEIFSPGARRGRKLARAVRKAPAFSVNKNR